MLSLANCSQRAFLLSGESSEQNAANQTGSVTIDNLKVCSTAPDVGHVVIHRLNNKEYDNTLNDLLGTSQRWTQQFNFPIDEYAGNFNNNARVLNITPATTQKYLEAAEAALQSVFSSTTLKARLINCDTTQTTCTESVLRNFLLKAFRRPPTNDEVARYRTLAGLSQAEGDTAEKGLQIAMIAALTSPNFVYRSVKLPDPAQTTTAVNLAPYELASRLSYFLWSSMPDNDLFALAASGELAKDTVLAAQVQRMLKDSKSAALTDSFGEQWLSTWRLDQATPSQATFQEFSEALRQDMKTESRMVFQDIVARDGSFFDLLNLDYTYVNQRLATHYGMSSITSTSFQKASLQGTARSGVLTHASILTLTSNPDRTSVVKRGKWVLENLLCAPPPPPPPDVVGSLPPAGAGDLTQRQLVELHRSNPVCFGCHAHMDPVGFSLENFNALGKFRETENGLAIDNLGEFPDGRKFQGAKELIQTISADVRFRTCVAEKLFEYALGRKMEEFDRCTVNRIGVNAVSSQQPMSAAIIELIKSDPFKKQRGDAP